MKGQETFLSEAKLRRYYYSKQGHIIPSVKIQKNTTTEAQRKRKVQRTQTVWYPQNNQNQYDAKNLISYRVSLTAQYLLLVQWFPKQTKNSWSSVALCYNLYMTCVYLTFCDGFFYLI